MECLKKDPHQIAYYHDGGDKFAYHGTCTYDFVMGMSSADIHYAGTQTMHLKGSDHKIMSSYPKLHLSGFISGNYHGYWDKHLYLWSNKINAFVQIKFAQQQGSMFSKAKKPLDYISGSCYKVSSKFLKAFVKLTTEKKKQKLIKNYQLKKKKTRCFKV